MRYLGNKEKLKKEIITFMNKQNALDNDAIFFDAFCGTGSISNEIAKTNKVVINDLLLSSLTFTEGNLYASQCNFVHLGFDPFKYFENEIISINGFFKENYSPSSTSNRMYFTNDNAGKIDFVRNKIEEWKTNKKINDQEYKYLLACLIESVSLVANTAGVYGAYLKKWDPRALKDFIFLRINDEEKIMQVKQVYNSKIEDIIEDVECDVLYLDPPYTQNQYGTQYHLLETLILNDNPEISKVTGSRSTSPLRSDWSKDYKVHILFERVVKKTKASHIFLSYSSDGLMSVDYISQVLKRYGVKGSFKKKKIEYKKYTNHKSKNNSGHFEYIFYIEKNNKPSYESPLNYIGNKAKWINSIEKYSPKSYNRCLDLFGGGLNVGINMGNSVVYNEYNTYVKELIESFYKVDTYEYLIFIKRIIKKFELEPNDADAYNKFRKFYNELPEGKKDPRYLYVLIMYGFNQQIRFNSDYKFNNPVGLRWFNDRLLEKFISYSGEIKEKSIEFHNRNYISFIDRVKKNDFVYLDPPYRLTTGSYNDGKRGFFGWTIEDEKHLMVFFDKLTNENVKVMLSYVVKHKDDVNNEILNWITKNGYNIIELPEVKGIKRKEVIIRNYE